MGILGLDNNPDYMEDNKMPGKIKYPPWLEIPNISELFNPIQTNEVETVNNKETVDLNNTLSTPWF